MSTHEETSSANGTFLPLLPLKNVVLLPRSLNPIIVGRPASVRAVESALRSSKQVFVTAQKNSDIEAPTADEIYAIGTRAVILQVMRLPKGALKIIVEGLSRSQMLRTEVGDGFLGVYCEDIPSEITENSIELEAAWRNLQEFYAKYVRHNAKAPAELLNSARTSEEIDMLADTLAVHINLTFDERQEILETANLVERLVKLARCLKRELEILETEERIRGRVQNQVEKSQREYNLTEQIKAIQKELGREDTQQEIVQLRNKAKSIGLQGEVLEKVEKELKRLEQMPALSSEAVVSRHYIDWILALPWNKTSKDTLSLEAAEKLLDASHAGLQKVKERIIEFIAAKKFSKKMERSPILCLVGPPGVGKTSLARAIAESLDRELVRISLGGIRDEAEIRGHRRTYIGALPGKIIQGMRKAQNQNPVMLLDEIDKMSSDIHGDPAAALLEVLDPEQNKAFSDHFLEIEYDLSKVMFIATANHVDGIPYPLFDRMELITLSGYTDDEKLDIATNFLIPKTLKEHGLKTRQIKLSSDVVRLVIEEYTKEAGVRQLERVLAKLMRKSIQIFLKDPSVTSVTISPAYVRTWLGYAKYKRTNIDKGKQRIGLATGLAWTELGGDVLEIEATVVSGKGGLTLTGQLGEVMQESGHAALSYVRSRATELGLKASSFSTKDIHLHVPEGATPKDGPSAGITMCVALISALTKNPVRPDVAMTGEITLRGRVLGVGGLKEKILAARQHGLKMVIVPHENKEEIEECLKEIGTSVTLVYVQSMDDVLALVNNPFTFKPARKAPTKRTRVKTSKARTQRTA
jgi:ATP-dependent Lon protease